MLMNIVLNYFMILKWGIVGAGIATIISNVFSWIALAYISNKIFRIFFKVEHLFKPLTASLVMCFVPSKLSLTSLFDCLIATVVGAVVYFGVLVVLRGLTIEDIRYFKVALGG